MLRSNIFEGYFNRHPVEGKPKDHQAAYSLGKKMSKREADKPEGPERDEVAKTNSSRRKRLRAANPSFNSVGKGAMDGAEELGIKRKPKDKKAKSVSEGLKRMNRQWNRHLPFGSGNYQSDEDAEAQKKMLPKGRAKQFHPRRKDASKKRSAALKKKGIPDKGQNKW